MIAGLLSASWPVEKDEMCSWQEARCAHGKRQDVLMAIGEMCSWQEARCAHGNRRDVLKAIGEMCSWQ